MINPDLIHHLEQFILDRRKQLINSILQNRTRYITVIFENIYQPHNASAVLRSCDCFGVQDVHIIENNNKYHINREVTLGSDKWLTLNKYNKKENNTLAAIKNLKNKGYRIIATTPHCNDTLLEDFDLNKGKIAIAFGTELNGLSEEFINNSDEFLKIPMYGFTESYNISVSAAIILHYLTHLLRNSNIEWKLPDSEMDETKLAWLKKSIKNSALIEKEFLLRKT